MRHGPTIALSMAHWPRRPWPNSLVGSVHNSRPWPDRTQGGPRIPVRQSTPKFSRLTHSARKTLHRTVCRVSLAELGCSQSFLHVQSQPKPNPKIIMKLITATCLLSVVASAAAADSVRGRKLLGTSSVESKTFVSSFTDWIHVACNFLNFLGRNIELCLPTLQIYWGTHHRRPTTWSFNNLHHYSFTGCRLGQVRIFHHDRLRGWHHGLRGRHQVCQ